MAYENIRFSKGNMAVYGNYFWMIDDILDMLIVKTDDGTQAFTYPLDTGLQDDSVTSIEFDGYNLWTLETINDTSVRIRRWYIHNYIVKLSKSWDLVGTTSNTWEAYSMAVESYEIYFTDTEVVNSHNLSVGDDAGGDVCNKLSSGNIVVLGPNANGRTEEFSVNSAGSSFIEINGLTSYEYRAGDSIRFYKNIWLFNNYDGVDDSTGALYRISPYDGSPKQKFPDNIYKNITASTFKALPYFVFNGGASTTPYDHAIAYVKGTNLIFLNPDDITTAYGSMVMDNLQDNMSVVIPIYDVSIDNRNVYRLQRQATYYGNTADFADNTYNYQLSTINSLITSISLTATPAILPANESATAVIKAIVKDQFNEPVPGKAVYFTADDPGGQILSTTVNTDDDGVASTAYQAGSEAREVRITSTCQQG